MALILSRPYILLKSVQERRRETLEREIEKGKDQGQEVTRKRYPGELTDKRLWLVLTESKGKEGVGFTHICGTVIEGVTVYLTVRDGLFPLSGSGDVKREVVPYCPNCEYEPQGSGTISPGNRISILPKLV